MSDGRDRQLDPADIILARLDERSRNQDHRFQRLEEDVKGIKQSLDHTYVSQAAFRALQEKVNMHQKVIFGVAATICLAVLSAFMALILGGGTP